MTKTTYSIHSSKTHGIVATADPSNLQEVVQDVAEEHDMKQQQTGSLASATFYVHNGRGVVGAFLARNREGTDIPREDYMQFDAKARDARYWAGLHNDMIGHHKA